jgi:hypothetical protein
VFWNQLVAQTSGRCPTSLNFEFESELIVSLMLCTLHAPGHGKTACMQ